MGIITISRGSYTAGKEVAAKLADKLGYESVSREILLEASEHYNVPEAKLIQVFKDAPSFFDRFRNSYQTYISYIRYSFLEHIRKDNIIYHGLAGQYFTQGIPNILKVRITANPDYRIRVVRRRNKIPESEARQFLHLLDNERRKWSMFLYGIDISSEELYDVVLHIDNITIDDAVDTLYKIARKPCYQTSVESMSQLDAMLAEAKSEADVEEIIS